MKLVKLYFQGVVKIQLSFNVIKNSRVTKQGDREINTQLSRASSMEIMGENNGINKANLDSYEKIASNIIETARRESEKIRSKAFVDAAEIKTLAFKDGKEQGCTEGYEQGYNKAMSVVEKEAEVVKSRADSILAEAKSQYNNYLIQKEKHIKDLIVNIAESILKKEVREPDALNEMIFNILKTERDIKLYIIKINNTHFEMVKSQIENFKTKLAFQGDIFVIVDDFLDDGTAVIEKETGKSIVSISYGIEKVIELLQEEQIQI